MDYIEITSIFTVYFYLWFWNGESVRGVVDSHRTTFLIKFCETCFFYLHNSKFLIHRKDLRHRDISSILGTSWSSTYFLFFIVACAFHCFLLILLVLDKMENLWLFQSLAGITPISRIHLILYRSQSTIFKNLFLFRIVISCLFWIFFS